MLNLKAQATEIINKLEMYARLGKFTRHHDAFVTQPCMVSYEQLLDAINGNSRSNWSEDNYVKAVYRSYWKMAERAFERDYELDQLVYDYNCFVKYRFPAPKSHAELDYAFKRRLAQMNEPSALALTLAGVLCRHRSWFNREFTRSNGEMHPAVFKAWELAAPADWHQLVMEWPHVSKEGHHKIAYTRDDKYGEADRQLVLSVSKYLTRHFPALPSNVIRDISGMYTEAQFGFARTMPEMLDIIVNGPPSCMSGEDEEFRDSDGHHPYEVYDPELGWHMAYVKEGSRYTGRVLLNDKTWVRTYRRKEYESSNSDTDERLNSWLREQGYSKSEDWVGFSFKRIKVGNNCGFVAPYLDCTNGHRDVITVGNTLEIVRSGNGEYRCGETCGDAETLGACTCPCCGYRCVEDDMSSVGYYGDESVCDSCFHSEYTTVYGRRGNMYAVPSEDAIEVNGQYYHDDWLSDNGIVQLHDGEYIHEDDAVYIESQGEYYPSESELICYTQAGEYELREDCIVLENGEWCLEDDAWQCEHSDEWYANDDVDSVETVCGKHIHPDHVEHYVIVNPNQQELRLE